MRTVPVCYAGTNEPCVHIGGFMLYSLNIQLRGLTGTSETFTTDANSIVLSSASSFHLHSSKIIVSVFQLSQSEPSQISFSFWLTLKISLTLLVWFIVIAYPLHPCHCGVGSLCFHLALIFQPHVLLLFHTPSSELSSFRRLPHQNTDVVKNCYDANAPCCSCNYEGKSESDLSVLIEISATAIHNWQVHSLSALLGQQYPSRCHVGHSYLRSWALPVKLPIVRPLRNFPAF
jgi:hypothetical protein